MKKILALALALVMLMGMAAFASAEDKPVITIAVADKTNVEDFNTNLQTLMIENLRAGDVLTRCSISQMIVMLPQANYENSCLVCQRILRAFHRQYPHTPAEITYSVQPLEPLAAAPHPQH